LGAFVAGLAFFARLTLLRRNVGATCASTGFFVAFDCSVTGASAVSVVSVLDVNRFLLYAITVMTSITLVRWECKANL